MGFYSHGSSSSLFFFLQKTVFGERSEATKLRGSIKTKRDAPLSWRVCVELNSLLETFLGTILLEVKIGRDFGALKGSSNKFYPKRTSGYAVVTRVFPSPLQYM